MDINVMNHGSICVMRGVSAAGREWIEQHVQQDDETQYWCNGIVVEPRYMGDIIEGAQADGLEVG